jgi:hypothetical protein
MRCTGGCGCSAAGLGPVPPSPLRCSSTRRHIAPLEKDSGRGCGGSGDARGAVGGEEVPEITAEGKERRKKKKEKAEKRERRVRRRGEGQACRMAEKRAQRESPTTTEEQKRSEARKKGTRKMARKCLANPPSPPSLSRSHSIRIRPSIVWAPRACACCLPSIRRHAFCRLMLRGRDVCVHGGSTVRPRFTRGRACRTPAAAATE